jgi:hypothetical protein
MTEIQIVRELAKKVREIAELPEMEIRRKQWYNHNDLKSEKPMILCFPEGAWVEIFDDKTLICRDATLRVYEKTLRQKIYWYEHINDDNTLDPFFDINWSTSSTGYGVEIPLEYGDNRGSYHWDAPIKDLHQDFGKLKHREFFVNRDTTLEQMKFAQDVFQDILPVRTRGAFYWTLGLTWEAIKLVGLENLMLLMYDDPDGLHNLMAFLRDDHMQMMDFFENEGLLTLNNEGDYVGSGGVGYTHQLPVGNRKEGNVQYKDLWGFGESQETVGVSPAMFNEFILPYQMPLLKRLGLVAYGCCEPLDARWDYIKTIPNLRRLSVSPWADQEKMSAYLGKEYIFSRKPNPTLIAVEFDEAAIRKDLRETMNVAKRNSCNLEIIMKDTHTVQNDPTRIERWVNIAKEEALRI